MSKLKFYEKSHKYKIGKTTLTSVTTFIGKFFEPFDAKGIARKLARFPINKERKHGVRYFLKDWKEAAEHGTRTHEMLELAIDPAATEEPISKENRDWNKFKQGMDWWEEYNKNTDVENSMCELRIYNEELLLAGTIDLMVVHKDMSISLIDWKTNKAIKKTGYHHKRAFVPIEDLHDCNYNKYTLQLSLYAYMMERAGYTIRDLIIVHLMEDKSKEYKVEYKKEIIKKLLEVKDGKRKI